MTSIFKFSKEGWIVAVWSPPPHNATVLQNGRHLFAGIPVNQLVLRVQFWFRALPIYASAIVRV
jgi:hypothetical protein